MNARIQRWGNSLAVRIPRPFAEDTGLQAGSIVDLNIRNGKIVIVSAPRACYSLGQLLKTVRRKNLHRETDTGESVGREVW